MYNEKMPQGLKRGLLLLLIAFAIGFGLVQLYKSQRANLFEYMPSIQALPSKFALRTSVAKINADAFGKGTITLDLLGTSIDANLVNRSLDDKYQAYEATLINGDVTIVNKNGMIEGSVHVGNRIFYLHGTGQNLVEVSEIDPTKIPAEEPGTVSVRSSENNRELTNKATTASQTTIDQSMFYTQQAVDELGGQQAAIANAALVVETTNTGLRNSGAAFQLRLVHVGFTNYQETNFDWYVTLSRLSTPNDGYMDNIQDERSDLNTLVVADSSYCGLSYVMNKGRMNASFSQYAFNIVNVGCASYYYSHGHEMAHQLGGSHDKAAGCYGAFPNSCAFVSPDNTFRTVESYPDACHGCPKRNLFSSASGTYNGATFGSVNADNIGTLNTTASIVAAFTADKFTNIVYLPLITR